MNIPSPGRRNTKRVGILAVALATALAALTNAAITAPSAGAATSSPSQPPQPASGPGGSDYTNSFRVHLGGSLDSAWYVFEPTHSKPRTAPVTIITHGYGEFFGYEMMRGLIEHTVRHGSIVIYPRWQATPVTPCPGPYNIDPCVTTTAKAIKQAINYLKADHTRVQPDLTRASYFGFSFGGIITANMANRWQSLSLPKPRVVMLDDPHDGGLPLSGPGEPALDDTLSGIPASTYFQCHSGAGPGGIIAKDTFQDSSCNAVFPKIGHIPADRKDLVMTVDDDHGTPATSSAHGVCGGAAQPGLGLPPTTLKLDVYDWNFCWKVWDALRDYAFHGTHKAFALGNTPRHRSMGTWSDGTPIKQLQIQDAAPLRP